MPGRATQAPPMADTLPHPDLVAALPRLRRYARALAGDLNRADDLVQDTLARAWEKRCLWQVLSADGCIATWETDTVQEILKP